MKAHNYVSRNNDPSQKYNTEVFGSTGSVGDDHFVRYSRKSVTLNFFNAKFQFGDCQNVRYSRKSVISESGTSENLCMIIDDAVMELSIGKTRFNNKSHYYNGFGADSGLSKFQDFNVLD